MKTNLSLTPSQADALARLIQLQLNAYEDSTPGTVGCREESARDSAAAPFTVGDLDLIAPLVALLGKSSKVTR